MGSTTVTLITLITVGLRAAVGVGWELQTTRLSPSVMQIICSLHEGFRRGDTLRIAAPPNNGTRTICQFPSPCLLMYPDDNVTYGQMNTTLSLTFTPEYSGLYSCIYNEEHGAVASAWITLVEPTDTTTPALNSSIAVRQDTPMTTEHVSETPASGSAQDEPGIWATYLGLILYQCI